MPRICALRSFLLTLFLLAVVALTSCSSAKNSPAEATPRTLSKTLFTEKLGLFVTHAPLQAGKASDLTLHLTNLAEGTPVDNAEVQFTFRAKRDQSSSNFPAVRQEPGIYRAEVTLPKAGEYYIEFHLTHPQFSGRLTMSDFEVE